MDSTVGYLFLVAAITLVVVIITLEVKIWRERKKRNDLDKGFK